MASGGALGSRPGSDSAELAAPGDGTSNRESRHGTVPAQDTEAGGSLEPGSSGAAWAAWKEGREGGRGREEEARWADGGKEAQ